MKIYYFLITFFLHTSITHANSNEMLISHDRIIYSPLDHLGKSISFDLQIEGLAEQVNKMESYGKVDNLIFNVLVKRGNIKEIQISGLKGKFRDLENNLKAKVLPYLELIFPTPLSRFYRGYELSGKGRKVSAMDKSYRKQIRESYLVFSKEGYLIENKLKSAQGTQIINFTYEQQVNGDKKVLLKKVSRKVIYGPTHLLSNTEVNYIKINGKEFPKKIETKFIFENKKENTNGKRVNTLSEIYHISNIEFK